MVIIVPETKRIANLAKHGIDIAEFDDAFSWKAYVAVPAKPSRTGRVHEMFIGTMHGRVVAAIVSPLGSEAMSLVSVRPASAKERVTYDDRT